MKIKLQELRELSRSALQNQGYTSTEAETIQEVLLYAQLRGNNQGVVKLTGPGIPKSMDTAPIFIEKETKTSAFINGAQNHAMLVVNQATDIAIKKASEFGMSIVGAHGINTSSGALGFYARKIAQAGLIGFVVSGSMETVAAEGSFEAIFGTNPLAFAAPTESGEPLVFDMTTSAMAYFGVVEASIAGKTLPTDIAYDKDGQLTTKPADVLDGGALRTFDQSHKGSGLSMMIQILTGPLMSAYFTGIGDIAKNWGGHFILALDPELFGGRAAAKQGVTQMIERVKATKRLPEVEEILVPGERGDRRTQEALKTGEVEIEESLYQALKEKAGS